MRTGPPNSLASALPFCFRLHSLNQTELWAQPAVNSKHRQQPVIQLPDGQSTAAVVSKMRMLPKNFLGRQVAEGFQGQQVPVRAPTVDTRQ